MGVKGWASPAVEGGNSRLSVRYFRPCWSAPVTRLLPPAISVMVLIQLPTAFTDKTAQSTAVTLVTNIIRSRIHFGVLRHLRLGNASPPRLRCIAKAPLGVIPHSGQPQNCRCVAGMRGRILLLVTRAGRLMFEGVRHRLGFACTQLRIVYFKCASIGFGKFPPGRRAGFAGAKNGSTRPMMTYH